MHLHIHRLTVLVGLVPLVTLHAQRGEEVRVIRAAIEFVRDTGAGPDWLPPEPIAIDAEMYRANPAFGDHVARTIGARRVRIGEERQCDAPVPGQRRTCTLRGNVTVVSYTQPVIRGDTAEVAIGWSYQEAPSLVAAKSVDLRLVREADGEWRVKEVLSRGMT